MANKINPAYFGPAASQQYFDLTQMVYEAEGERRNLPQIQFEISTPFGQRVFVTYTQSGFAGVEPANNEPYVVPPGPPPPILNWIGTLGIPGAVGIVGASVSYDTVGNLYLTGGGNAITPVSSFGGSGFPITNANSVVGISSNVVVAKYNKTGNIQWQNFFTATGVNQQCPGVISLDTSANIFLTTSWSGLNFSNGNIAPTALEANGQLIKLASNGSMLWNFQPAANIGGVANNNGIAGGGVSPGTSGNTSFSSMALDAGGNVFTCGMAASVQVVELGGSIFLMKQDPNGNVLWNIGFEGYTFYGSAPTTPIGLTVDSGGSPILMAYNSQSQAVVHVPNADTIVIVVGKYNNATGAQTWVTAITANAATTSGIYEDTLLHGLAGGITTDTNNNIYLIDTVANYVGSVAQNGTGVCVTQLTPNGNVGWQTIISNTSNIFGACTTSTLIGVGIVSGNNDDLYIAMQDASFFSPNSNVGNTTTENFGGAIVLGRMDQGGNVLWTNYVTTNTGVSLPYGVYAGSHGSRTLCTKPIALSPTGLQFAVIGASWYPNNAPTQSKNYTNTGNLRTYSNAEIFIFQTSTDGTHLGNYLNNGTGGNVYTYGTYTVETTAIPVANVLLDTSHLSVLVLAGPVIDVLASNVAIANSVGNYTSNIFGIGP